MTLHVFHINGPELPILESVDLSGADGHLVAEHGVHDLKFHEFCFRENSYAKAIHGLSDKYSELIDLSEQRAVYLNEQFNARYQCVTLVWRTRPYLDVIKNKHGTLIGYQARFRLAVIPDLSEEGWEDFLRIPSYGIPLGCQPEKAAECAVPIQ